MGLLAEIIGAILFGFVFNIILYPFGLLRIWFKEKTKKSFIRIIEENSFRDIVFQGRVCMLDLVAGLGALSLTAVLFFSIGLMFYNIIKALWH